MKIKKIYAEVLEREALDQFYEAMKLDCNIQGALMPDAHAGYTLPIGAVIKSDNKIFPSYVGYDIGCGMISVKTNVQKFTEEDLIRLKELIMKKIPLGRDTHKKKQVLPKKFKGRSEIAEKVFKELAPYQLGTLGGGNHFIEIGTDNSGSLNIVIHSGSRGVGKKIAEYYMRQAAIEDVDMERYENEFNIKNTWRDKNPEGWEKAKKEFIYRRTRARLNTNMEGHHGFSLDSKTGKDYLFDLNEALDFALANRKHMIDNILVAMKEVFGDIKTDRFINRNHNHAEIVDGYVIHRKGATHSEPGMYGVIPGNMKDGSFIVVGAKDSEEKRLSMNSSSHGAGRVLSRRAAKDNLNVEEFHSQMKGIVTNHSNEMIDEAPKAYKNIFEVMEQQKDLVDVIDRVVPVLNIKG